MQQFDFSDPDMPNSERATSIVPQQALFLMNSPMVVDIARKIVARKEFSSASDDAQRVAALYSIIFQRTPRSEETKFALAYMADLQRTLANAPAVVQAPAAPARRGAANPEGGRAAVRNQGETVERPPSPPGSNTRKRSSSRTSSSTSTDTLGTM